MKTDKTEEVTMDTPLYTISVAAQLVGVSVHTLRMYETQGLLIPFKKESRHRMYSQFDISRLKCIRDIITNHKFTISGIKGMLSLIPCWKIVNCSDEERNNCSAYNGSFEPCWSYKHKNNVCATNDCRLCPVFKEWGSCKEIKTSIKKFIT